jgi:uncharacterized membrane protein
MNHPRLPTFLFCFLLLLGILRCVQVYPQLPDVMASHFSGRGVPNNFQPKSAFFLIFGVVTAVCAIPAFFVPRRLLNLSPDKINLPNKSYWLAPERREDTFRFFRAQMAWWGCALLFLLLYTMILAINANLRSVGYFNGQRLLFALGAFLLFTVCWLVHFVGHFLNVPDSPSSPHT